MCVCVCFVCYRGSDQTLDQIFCTQVFGRKLSVVLVYDRNRLDLNHFYMIKEQYISNDWLFSKGQQIKPNLIKQHKCNIDGIITYTLNNKTAAIQ